MLGGSHSAEDVVVVCAHTRSAYTHEMCLPKLIKYFTYYWHFDSSEFFISIVRM